MHTPGVITALVQLAPPFSGIITGFSFFAVAWFSIANKILTKQIVKEGNLIKLNKSDYHGSSRVRKIISAPVTLMHQ